MEQQHVEDTKKLASAVLADHITLRVKSDTLSGSLTLRYIIIYPSSDLCYGLIDMPFLTQTY